MIKSYKLRRHIANAFVYLFLIVMGFIWISPFIYLLMHSFRGGAEIYGSTIIPQEWTLQNYIDLFTGSGGTASLNFPRWFLNTFVVACFSCVISTISVLMVSYAFSRLRFKARKKFMNVGMILGMFPGFMSMIAVYYILKSVGLSEGAMIRVALVLVYSGGAGLGFYIAKGFFDTIPKSIDEAAYLDGATRFQVFTKITIPLSKPIIVYTILQAFMAPWLDFIFAKVICRANAKYYTVSIGLWNMFEKEYVNSWFNCFAAGAVLISIPIVILFMSMQKCYQEGVSGAVKG